MPEASVFGVFLHLTGEASFEVMSCNGSLQRKATSCGSAASRPLIVVRYPRCR